MSTTARSIRGERIAIVTLGCPKNLVDSELLLGSLHRAGYAVAPDIGEADLVVVNTCAFLTASQQESIETILEVARLKKTGRLRSLVVAGCLPQRHGASVLDEIPEVDYLLGPGTLDQVVDVAHGLLDGSLSRGARLEGLDRADFDWEPRVLSEHRHTAYLKISEGCNNTCSFCIIPRLRGRHRSRPLEELAAEARRLAAAGVQEITLVAQDTTCWGLDLYGRFSLHLLLEALDRVEGIRWIRLLYTYPRYWTEELLEACARLPRVVPYVDMPIQHAADPVLRRMRRGAGWETTLRWLHRLREAVPEIALRTTVIAGFPGETDADFEILLERIREFEFDHLGVFAYSTEDETPAADLPDPVPQELREERRGRILAQQRGISLRRNRRWIGGTLEVLVDSVESDRGIARGRWAGQALEIDGQVIVALPPRGPEGGPPPLRPGAFVPVRVRGAGPYDLVGSLERRDTLEDPRSRA